MYRLLTATRSYEDFSIEFTCEFIIRAEKCISNKPNNSKFHVRILLGAFLFLQSIRRKRRLA